MKATLVQIPVATPEFWALLKDTEFYAREVFTTSGVVASQSDSAALFAETAGRLCYSSWSLPNPKTATNATYLDNIRHQLHFSVIEHANFSFHISGISRALLAELSRHRHFSLSVRSQRYCSETRASHTVPLALTDPALGERGTAILRAFHDHQGRSLSLYREIQVLLLSTGAPRKTANDAARYALTEATHTELFITGNARTWTEFLDKRTSPAAAAEIRTLALTLSKALTEASPNLFPERTEEK